MSVFLATDGSRLMESLREYTNTCSSYFHPPSIPFTRHTLHLVCRNARLSLLIRGHLTIFIYTYVLNVLTTGWFDALKSM